MKSAFVMILNIQKSVTWNIWNFLNLLKQNFEFVFFSLHCICGN